MKFFNQLLDLIYPENLYCVCCGDTIEQSRIHGLCDSCIERIPWFTDNPFKNQMEDFAFSGVLPCCLYGFYARPIISKVKLAGAPYAAKGIGILMGERMKNEMDADPSFRPDAILAVPMHRDKMQTRGFNQAELLASYAAAQSGVEYLPGALIKIQATESMRMSDANTRRQLLQGSFAISGEWAERIKGRHLILLDDVMTTGSTVDAVSRVLLSAGARRVDILCFAVTPNKKDV